MTQPIPDNTPTAKACPRCAADVRLVVKTNRNNGTQFLGCPNWPDCSHTEALPESMKLAAAGQKRLL